MENNILLICNDELLAKEIKSKILLLRNNDSFFAIDEKNSLKKIKEKKPSVIFYHIDEDVDIATYLIKNIKQINDIKNVSIIALLDDIDEEKLCTLFEQGITDFIHTIASETEYTIRTIWALQKKSNIENTRTNEEILAHLDIIDKKNKVYTENYTYNILKEQSKKNWGTFVSLAPDINTRNKISPITLMNTIKKCIRSHDILGYASDFKIYLWFRKTEKKNVYKIFEKIQKELTNNFTISAGYIETKDIDFDKAENLANKALSKALLKGNCFIYAIEKKEEELKTTNFKNFKLEKENTNKKIEKILSPLFYQIQKRLEEKLFETNIKQFVKKDLSCFYMESKNTKSYFNVNYTGLTQIFVETIHYINKEEIKNEKLSLDKNEFCEERIEYLLDLFIQEFQDLTKK